MPVTVRYKPIKGPKDWAIVEKSTGRVEGRSATRSAAQRSANAINASAHGWKPTRRRGK